MVVPHDNSSLVLIFVYVYQYYYDYIAERDEYKKELLELFSTIRQWNILTLVYLFGGNCQYFYLESWCYLVCHLLSFTQKWYQGL